MAKFDIRSEYTAQASTFQPNCMIQLAIESLYHDKNCKVVSKHSKVADQGCGKLRHLEILTSFFQRIHLIDQYAQLTRKQKLFNKSNTNIIDYIKKKFRNGHISTMTSTNFSKTKLNLDLILNSCVFDVVPPNVRNEITVAAYSNLRNSGVFVLIIPRNDYSILKRCDHKNKYWDGHIFSHHGIHTFFKNFRDHNPLIKTLKKVGFDLLQDLSVYRHVCLILRK